MVKNNHHDYLIEVRTLLKEHVLPALRDGRERMNALDKRIRVLESGQAKIVGIAVGFSSVAAVFVSIVIFMLTN